MEALKQFSINADKNLSDKVDSACNHTFSFVGVILLAGVAQANYWKCTVLDYNIGSVDPRYWVIETIYTVKIGSLKETIRKYFYGLQSIVYTTVILYVKFLLLLLYCFQFPVVTAA